MYKTFLFLLLFLTNLYFFSGKLVVAEQLAPDVKLRSFNDFSGGMNTNTVPHKMNEKYSPYISNIFPDYKFGQIGSVNGFTVLGTTPTLGAITFLDRFIPSTGAVQFLVSDGTTVLKTSNFSTWETVRTGLSGNFQLNGKQIEDKYWFTNKNDSVFTWNGSSMIILNGSPQAGVLTPNVPQGQFIEYWQGRVFMYNTTNSVSEIQFCDIASTDSVPVKIAPDNVNAWPRDNEHVLNFLPGNGEEGTAMWVYKYQLHVGKPSGIGVWYGIDENDFKIKELPMDDGPESDSSVVVADNVTYYLGKRHVNQFDGQTVTPLTKGIEDDIEQIENRLGSIDRVLYDLSGDFTGGTFGGAHVRDGGVDFSNLIVVSSQAQTSTTTLTGANFDSGYISITSITIKSFFHDTSSQTLEFAGVPYIVGIWGRSVASNPFSNPKIVLKNSATGKTVETTFLWPEGDADGSFSILSFAHNDTTFSKRDLETGALQYRIYHEYFGGTVPTLEHAQLQIGAVGSYVVIKTTSGQYESPISTATGIIGDWGKFTTAQSNISPPDILYRYRVGTSIANIISQPWVNITPGADVSGNSSQAYFQWGASATTLNTSGAVLETVDSAQAVFTAPGNAGKIPAAYRDGRYWLAVSTGINMTSRLLYIKSKQIGDGFPAWTLIEGVNVSALLNTSDVFYGGSSESGTVYRIDFGDTFNGAAINPKIRTAITTMERPLHKKQAIKYCLDAEGTTADEIDLSVYVDTQTVKTHTFTLSQTGNNYVCLNDVQKANGFKWQFELGNAAVGTPLKINGLDIYYKDTNETFR